MTYVLHGVPGSGSGIVEAALAELDVPHELRDLDARNAEHRGDAYAALNPHRKMPTLETPKGEVLTETVAILLTLDERHPEAGLLPPPGSPERALALRWMLYCATELYPAVELMDYPERFAPEAADAVKAGATALWHRRWLTLEREIRGEPYALEGGFSATDLYITVLSRWDMTAEWRRETLPRVNRLAEAVKARPALAAAWARHMPRG